MAYIQQIFRENKDLKIVLSEEVYTRLAGCINLCGFDMGFGNREFGTVLYGNAVDNNTINFGKSSEHEDYQQKTGSFTLSENMWNELVKKTSSRQFDCIAHVHTHPFFGYEYNRFLSSADVDFYKKMGTTLGTGFHTFGCMLSVSGNNTPYLDDISFVYYDSQTGELCSVPNIYVCMGEIEVPLRKENGTYKSNGVKYTFERTLFELGETPKQNLK